jgi:hypothetical protein
VLNQVQHARLGPALCFEAFRQEGVHRAPPSGRDLPNNAINLTPGFFTSLTDGSRVTLTFHFWSGATVTYHVTKSGTSITGTKGQP